MSQADIDTLTYEQARDELIAIVAKLEAGAATLDESLGLWERGEALAARCQDLLDGARDRITQARGEDDDADAGVVAVVAEAQDTEEDE
ncbi:exodeoxyribonuclease VII small subunit [Demequina sp. NBRC 110056]|uniref:exodeoxyribonuclease VII small subunit n=1 Tax=Demequina sp. NBRC 110056 TaxID=1570345 RepID=UPI000A06FEDE|nr:exodeoxyribonuclease VII small subunit [Demequina sp. NBRC 110056]